MNQTLQKCIHCTVACFGKQWDIVFYNYMPIRMACLLMNNSIYVIIEEGPSWS